MKGLRMNISKTKMMIEDEPQNHVNDKLIEQRDNFKSNLAICLKRHFQLLDAARYDI